MAKFFTNAILKKDQNYFSTICGVKFHISPMFLSLHLWISVNKQDIYTYLMGEEQKGVEKKYWTEIDGWRPIDSVGVEDANCQCSLKPSIMLLIDIVNRNILCDLGTRSELSEKK